MDIGKSMCIHVCIYVYLHTYIYASIYIYISFFVIPYSSVPRSIGAAPCSFVYVVFFLAFGLFIGV